MEEDMVIMGQVLMEGMVMEGEHSSEEKENNN
jgi:hypothetical protein